MRRIGDYPVIRKLGEGGMGRIYLVKDEHDGSMWAAKQFKGDMSKPLFVQRFRREFRALKSLDHPAIVRVREMEYRDDLMFFLMEFVAGRSLDRVLLQPRENNPDWIQQVLKWIAYLCEPLEYIHNQRMVHRDLKPGNIMILGPESDPPLKLLDFGIIHWFHSDSITTATPTFLGSLRYMAPEQMNNSLPDLRSDIYSLGVILYEAVTGRAPFAVENPLLLMSLHQTAEPPPPRQYNLHVTESLQNLMLTMLAKRPDDRPSSAREVADWIYRILDGNEFTRADPRCSVFLTGILFTPELCGRDAIMRKLLHCYSDSEKGEARIATIHGKTGVGKTRVATQFERLPELAQRIICHGEFQKDGPLHNGFIYGLKQSRLALKKRQMMQLKNDGFQYRKLYEAIDETVDLLMGTTSDSDNPLNLKSAAAQILDVLTMLAHRQPVVLILDDLHHAKPGDIALIKHMITLHNLGTTGHSHQGLFMALGFRDEKDLISFSLNNFLEWLDQRKIQIDIHLKGLDKIAVNRMVTSLLGGSPAPVLGATIFEESNGNPLHIIEILRELIENQVDPSFAMFSNDEPTLAIPGSDRITQIMGRRVDRFEDQVRDVIHAGAVLGKSFRADELEMVCQVDDNVFLDQVDQLLRQRVLEEDAFQGGTYRFMHQKLREAVYNKIPDDELMMLHKRALTVMEELHTDQLGQVSERLLGHARYCGETRKIMEYHVIASDYANSMGDQIEAKSHIEAAIEILNEVEIDSNDRQKKLLQMNVSLGSLLRRTGDVQAAEKILLSHLPVARQQNEDVIYGKIQKQLGALWGGQARVKKAIVSLEEALEIFKNNKMTGELIDCYINLGGALIQAEMFDDALHYLKLAMEKAQLVNDKRRLIMAMINIGVYHASQYQGEEALPYLHRACDICDEVNDRRLKAYTLMSIASSYISFDPLDEHVPTIISITDQVIELVRKTGETGLLLDSLYKRSIACNHVGEPVIEDLDRAIDIAVKLGQSSFASQIKELRQKVLSQQR